MRADVLLRALRGVAIEQMRQLQRVAERPLGPRGIAQVLRMLHEQGEQRHRIGAPPFAGCPRLVPADRPIARQPHQRVPAAQFDRAFEARRTPTDGAPLAVGQRGMDRAADQCPVDPVDDLADAGRHQPRDQTRPANETLRSGDKLAPAGGGRHIHRPRYGSAICRSQARGMHRCAALAGQPFALR